MLYYSIFSTTPKGGVVRRGIRSHFFNAAGALTQITTTASEIPDSLPWRPFI